MKVSWHQDHRLAEFCQLARRHQYPERGWPCSHGRAFSSILRGLSPANRPLSPPILFEDAYKQNHGNAMMLSWSCAGREPRHTIKHISL
jgi:hypothetical protein